MRLVALLLLLLPVLAGAATIERAWAAWRPADYFDSLGEHLTGRENMGREVVLRSQPESREGFYLLVRLHADSGSAKSARLEVVHPDAHQPRTYTWELPQTGRTKQVYQFGVTGKDWTHPERLAFAWKISLLDASGAILASKSSFLWEAPSSGK